MAQDEAVVRTNGEGKLCRRLRKVGFGGFELIWRKKEEGGAEGTSRRREVKYLELLLRCYPVWGIV